MSEPTKDAQRMEQTTSALVTDNPRAADALIDLQVWLEARATALEEGTLA